MDDETTVIVIDSGTGYVRAGFPTSKGPRSVTPNVLGRCLDADADPSLYLLGDNLLRRGQNYSREYPMEKGVVVNWDLMEKMWDEILREDIRCFPDESVFILTDSTFSPKTQRNKMAEIFFETFNSPAIKIVDQSMSGLNFLWRNTGLVIDMGYESTRVVPVYNGHAIAHHGIDLHYGGKDMTSYLGQLLPDITDHATIQDIKEKKCYVAYDFEEEMTKAKTDPSAIQTNYEIPNGTQVMLGNERFKVPEILFDPSIIGKADLPLPKAIHDVIMNVDPEIRDQVMKNIYMCGNTAMTPNITARLQKEVSALFPESQLKVRGQNGCPYITYYGAPLLRGIPEPNLSDLVMLREHYDEDGPTAVHRWFY
eukprot:TRINITY_DN11933_c0_g1_i1.p1 TRINITY_DN11933_c0_g1~~TRINITY_DN11933_c0_g1_i1.p1  ORF type:complete len:367 (-),score=32.63 TRINITY_DN11933_c0_g1_i1:2-1102(-)